MASSASASSVLAPAQVARSHFNVHPTALISACDFLARIKAERKLGLVKADELLIGLVIGHPSGSSMEVVDCAEAKYSTEPHFSLDKEFIQNKHNMLKKVDPNAEIVGWFCFGAGLPQNVAEIQSQFSEATQNLLRSVVRGTVLTASSTTTTSSGIAVVFHEIDSLSVDELPVSVFSFGGAAFGGSSSSASDKKALARETMVKLALDPAEEIAMSAISKLDAPNNTGESNLIRQYRVMRAALEKLNSRVCVIQSYLEGVQKGEIATDHAVLKKIASITAQLPLVEPEATRLGMQEKQNEAVVFQYLSGVLKSAGTMHEVLMNAKAGKREGGGLDRFSHRRLNPASTGSFLPVQAKRGGGM